MTETLFRVCVCDHVLYAEQVPSHIAGGPGEAAAVLQQNPEGLLLQQKQSLLRVHPPLLPGTSPPIPSLTIPSPFTCPPLPFPCPFPKPLPSALIPSLPHPNLFPPLSLPFPQALTLSSFPKPLPPPLTLPLPVRSPSPVPHLSLALPSSNTSYQTGVECAPVNISTEQWNDEQQFYGMPTRNDTVIEITPATETKTGMNSSLTRLEYFARSDHSLKRLTPPTPS